MAKNMFITAKFLSVLYGIALVLLSLPANSNENGEMSYSKINKMLTIIDEYAKSPYTGLIATIKPEVEEIQFSDIYLAITHEGKNVKNLVVDDEGLVDFPLLPVEMGKNARLEINQPKGSVSLDFTAGIKPIRKNKVAYSEVFGVLDDLETVASELVGIPSWLIPDIDYIEFSFNSTASITLQYADNSTVHQTKDDFNIQIERNDDLKASGAMLIFSKLPQKVTVIK
ncbi:hypothetical protein [Pseudoalteromonas sp. H105]|uniref:hypothetical protein n=1 Tax=Pseudoalteromonas sp. H105 TaxID=1348393 RepID=UPI0007321587|nr:hypothetical protein [Pseudoalteromonas sp. H105]KTF16035.1 hypothetical protein ATS75_06425 [Pseudoalteromonas sp. H105]